MNPMQDLTQETMDLLKTALTKQADISKSGITVSGLGLVGYELQAPAKSLFPVLSPLRNRFARIMAPVGSQACTWRAITGINTSNVKAAVAFGARNANAISYTTANKSATYKTFGMDDIVDDEAVWQARGFQDMRALSALSTLQSTMIEEEKLLLGGLGTTNTLGTTPTPTSQRTASGGGTWTTTDNVYCKCVALPLYGWLNSKGTTYNSADLTQALADHAIKSALATQALTATTDSVQFAVTPVDGAFAYAWYIKEGASQTDATTFLAAITTVPSVSFTTAAGLGSNDPVTAYTTDSSGDTNAFDGVMSQLVNPNATYSTLDTSLTSGTLKIANTGTTPTSTILFDMKSGLANQGSTLTADGAGGIKEVDLVLKALWDKARIGPSLVLMNSQEAMSITRVIGANNTGSTIRLPVNIGSKDLTGGIFVNGYLNKFTSSMTPGMPDVIPFMIHPYLAPGTMILLSEKLPYPNSNVANVFEVETQSEYTDYEWARSTRQYQHGVYAQEVLKVYFPAGCAVIRSIAPS